MPLYNSLRSKKIISRVTPTSFWENFRRSFLSTETYYIQAPNLNEQIALFSLPPLPNLVDSQSNRRLIFYLKHIDYDLSFPFSGFFHSVFRFY